MSVYQFKRCMGERLRRTDELQLPEHVNLQLRWPNPSPGVQLWWKDNMPSGKVCVGRVPIESIFGLYGQYRRAWKKSDIESSLRPAAGPAREAPDCDACWKLHGQTGWTMPHTISPIRLRGAWVVYKQTCCDWRKWLLAELLGLVAGAGKHKPTEE